MTIFRARRRTQFLLVILLVGPPAVCADRGFAEPARLLAGKIADSSGPGAIALAVKNLSQLSNSETSAVEGELRAQLTARCLRVVAPDAAAAEVRVTLSQNLRGYLWVAEIRQGTERTAVMVSVPLAEPVTEERNAPAVVIRSALLLSHKEPILDAVLLDDAMPYLVVLSRGDISLYRKSGDDWELLARAQVTHSRPWPRDLRGRLVVRGERLFDAYLPGVV